MVPVTTELALVRQYLDVMKARLEDQLTFDIACGANAESTQVPALLLQPLVENAVEHGQDPATGRLDIGIGVERVNGTLNISIRDHGRGVSPKRSSNGTGHGLANARKRLATVYGDRASLRLNTHADGGAVVEIVIPQ
jgi:sensor histidine kinase YesM